MSNKKYKINKLLNENQPSDEEILKHKDFKKLSANYDKITKRPKMPLYKNPIAFIILVIVILILLFLFGEL